MRHHTLPHRDLLCLTLIVALTLALSSCGDGLGGFLISDAQEQEIGEEVDAQIESDYRVLPASDPLTGFARDLVAPLADASTEFRDPDEFGGYKVEVIQDDALVNAFAGPGGYVYVTTGLLMEAGSCAEVAGVLGHELAHVTERHSVQMIEQQFAFTTLASWFLGDGLAEEAVGVIYDVLVTTKFSRDDETEADRVGLQITYRAGYNPYGMVDFFETLKEMEGAGGAVPEFLSTHPATEDRISNIRSQIEQRYGAQVQRGETQTYRCQGSAMSLDEAKQLIRSR